VTAPATGVGDARVSIRAIEPPRYADAPDDPRLVRALSELSAELGWSDAEGRPFGGLVPRGARVLVKPNWVLHQHRSGGGIDELVTHASLIRAVVDALLRTDARAVLVGDAPLQGCDFDRLLEATGMGAWGRELASSEPRFTGVRDFRRTRSIYRDGVRVGAENLAPLEQFVLFDLGAASLLEPITRSGRFRVTQYDPRLLARTHAVGRHQYLVARDVIEADVIVNLPKLKTHKKAGMTGALKNLIGINGNKEYLPHHRIGGAGAGGDCYPGSDAIKRMLEFAYDRVNRSRAHLARRMWSQAVRVLNRVRRSRGDQVGVEGAWSGNDTIWRTCLDLNRVLLYGTPGGSLAPMPQRRVVNVVDAVIAGEGDGPLSPLPLPLGLLFAGESSAAVDWVGAWLLGYDPKRIPIVSHAFDSFPWPLVSFTADRVRVAGALGDGPADALLAETARRSGVRHPAGWAASAAVSPAA
jgi:uncharacterized protein (DUF362 family)